MKAAYIGRSGSESCSSTALPLLHHMFAVVIVLLLSLASAFADGRRDHTRSFDCRPQVTCGGCSGGSRECTVVACDGGLERYSQVCAQRDEAPVPKFPESVQTPWSRPSCSPQIQCGGCSGGAETCTAISCDGGVRQYSQHCEYNPRPQPPTPPPSANCSPQVSCGGCSGGAETCTAISCSGQVRQFSQSCVYDRPRPKVRAVDEPTNQRESGSSKSDDDGVVWEYPSWSGGPSGQSAPIPGRWE